MDKAAVVRALREISSLLQLKGESQFKVRAYDMGAQALERYPDDVAVLVEENRLRSVRGIGDSLSAKITELVKTGKCAFLEELRAELPPGIVEMTQVPNLGPKKVQALRETLRIESVAELLAACEAGLVRGIKGFGEKTEQNILAGIRSLKASAAAGAGGRVALGEAMIVAEPLIAYIRACPAVWRAELAGSLRRFRETVADLDIVVGTDDGRAVMDHFVAYPEVLQVDSRGDTKCSVHLHNHLQVDLRVLPPVDFFTALHHFTGSKNHHVKLRGIARELGYTISEWGVARIDDAEDKLLVESEADLYKALGLQFVPPELREDEGEIEAARAGTLEVTDLVTQADIAGMVHCHTTYSDGRNSIEEMARAAEAMGMRYLTITDHSPAAHYANGVEIDRLKRQWDEIAAVQQRVKVKLLRGTESDILEDGSLDYPDEVLEQLDIVIASIHVRHKMDEAQMTRRVVRAMRHPVFKVWGHALGRLLLQREPFACRVDEVLDAIAESRAAIEVNGDPKRLDLPPQLIRVARKRHPQLRWVVSTDAHSTENMANLRFGIGAARRGGVRRGEVLNALPVEEFCAAVRPAQ